MPKIFDLNPIGVLVASLAFFFAGFVIYGVLFSELWMALEGVTEADAEGAGMGWLAPALVITVMQVIGIGLLLKWRGAETLRDAAWTAFVAWLVLAVPLMAYDPIYNPNASWLSLALDGLHLFVGWVGTAAILTLMK